MNRLTLGALRACGPLLPGAAFIWRSLLFRTTVIAITGSVGKTMAKDCLAAVLAPHAPTVKTIMNRGAWWNIPWALLRARPWHRGFVVAEVGIERPGVMWRSALILRPDIAIVLHVKRNHSDAFETLERTASEKAQLLRRLRRGGVAILNGDDPRVMAMAEGAPFEVVTFGRSPSCDVRASDETSRWPDRLEFTAHAAGQQARVRTRFVGTHWVPSLLAVLAAAIRSGLTLEQAVGPIAAEEPFMARMQPVELPGGATIIRDEFNSSIDTLVPAVSVLEHARAARRWLVVTDFTDSGMTQHKRLKALAHMAASSADRLVLIGEAAAYGRRRAIEAGMAPGHVHTFLLLRQAAEFLHAELGAGDLVLLRGRARDHLSRIAFAQVGTVACWKARCQRRGVCDTCPELGFAPASGTAAGSMNQSFRWTITGRSG
jgi:UDP-N-acetylmuramoyl-tripeptide--D-alanyl-D-alanine ligase